MSQSTPSNLSPSKPRDPLSTLFNNPTRSASHASLLPGTGATSGPPPSSTFVTSPPSHLPPAHPSITSPTTTAAPGGALNIHLSPAPSSLPLPLPISLPPISLPSLPRRESTRATDRTDALWAEMQATLEAVELTASGAGRSGGESGMAGGGPRVFGPDHEHKLDELRAAQIALAQAWARSEADEAIETVGVTGEGVGIGGTSEGGIGAGRSDGFGGGGAGGTDGGGGQGGKSTAGTASAAGRPGSSGIGVGMGVKMEEETEVDILLARKRREANDRYFQRVNQGVLDVVAKLEEVAIAMRAVEQESKELWGDESESVPGSAKA